MWLDDDTRLRLARARDLLERIDETSPTVSEVARATGISRFHFIRVFAATFGTTPHRYRAHARLDRAKHLLALGRCSVTEACTEVGFSSLGSFSALFTRHVGETPSSYRRRARVLAQVPGQIAPMLIPGCFSLLAHLPADAFRNFGEAPDAPAR
jgi:AraC-like DNA-binding protein